MLVDDLLVDLLFVGELRAGCCADPRRKFKMARTELRYSDRSKKA